jgi:glycosyltransferase involved in cell wall biosynthesis
MEALARGLPVEFTGPILDPRQLAESYRAADHFCYPSLAEKGESFGVAPLEAMACGVPVIVSSLECFQDFVTEGQTGFVFDHRGGAPAEALAAVLERAMTSTEAVAIGRRAAEKARSFSYAAVAEQYLADFAALLAR